MNSQRKESKKVILWGREDLLGRSVELFLVSRKEWEVTRISDDQSEQILIEYVNTFSPDVVIIHQGDCAFQTNLPMQLLENHPALKVITVSLENNTMVVYNKQKLMVKEVDDLISVIKS